MAGRQFVVNLPAKTVAKVAKATAKAGGFHIDETDLFSFRLKKGNFPLSLIAGAFIAYCNFEVVVEEDVDGTTAFSMRRNTPWWTGAIGVHRVNKACLTLADEIADERQEQGGTVSEEKDLK